MSTPATHADITHLFPGIDDHANLAISATSAADRIATRILINLNSQKHKASDSKMSRLVFAIIFGVLITGCTQESSSTPEAARPASQSDARSTRMELTSMSPASAYYIACASCHETGANGAPLTGDRVAWSTRSSLWQAVLAQHAIDGFMDMPAKGGRVELSDWVVIRATDYMMSLTYPEMPTE